MRQHKKISQTSLSSKLVEHSLTHLQKNRGLNSVEHLKKTTKQALAKHRILQLYQLERTPAEGLPLSPGIPLQPLHS